MVFNKTLQVINNQFLVSSLETLDTIKSEIVSQIMYIFHSMIQVLSYTSSKLAKKLAICDFVPWFLKFSDSVQLYSI